MYIYIDAMHMVPADSAAGKKFIADQKKAKAVESKAAEARVAEAKVAEAKAAEAKVKIRADETRK